ncbi:hypothetical protein ACJ73_05886 [Blastomyces percursus]|uniref:Uncharacterized protein n=1 Tax=Blastomyces percursus TaxID=1658174 RepID=A0A1J9Q2H2_9EURO|nr:hypothetical protein ACJ73_05886 [Blastomyces percursus]
MMHANSGIGKIAEEPAHDLFEAAPKIPARPLAESSVRALMVATIPAGGAPSHASLGYRLGKGAPKPPMIRSIGSPEA